MTAAIIRYMAARARRVLVGYDGSESAERALDAAAALVGYGSTLTVAHVAPLGAGSQDALSDARERLLGLHVSATYLQLAGDAADELVDAVQVLGADLIVLGGRSQNGHLELGLGPVTGDVVGRAPCDVLVVK
jgi:nucleotide-binding universal stress UspA family protein